MSDQKKPKRRDFIFTTSYALGATLTPVKGLKLQALYNIYDNNYSCTSY